MKKFLLFSLLGLVVLVIAGFLVISFSLGSIVKKGVNTFGPQILQTKVELASAKISPFSGKGSLGGLTIGNPPGWETPRAFYLGEISIDLEPKSITGDHIIINSIIIDNPEITYETKITSSNLQDLVKNMQKSGGETAPSQPGEQPSTQPTTKEGKPVKIEIKEFRFKNAKVTVAGAGQQYVVDIPVIAFDNLGTKEGGLTPQQLSMVIMKEITARAVEVGVKAAAKKGLFDKAGEGLNKLLGGKK